MRGGKAALVLALAALVFAFFFFDLGSYLNLSYLKAQQSHIQAYAAAHPVQSAAIFFTGYVTITALSLPAAAVLTLLGGAIFGFALGTVLCSFAATAGATIAFLVARFLLRDMVLARFGDSLGPLNRGIEKDGAFYLFTLRLVPIFPFFVVNLAMALTPIRAFTFAWVSQVGMLAGTAVFVNAGTQLARLESLDGILSPGLIGSFVLLGVFPWVARRGLEVIKERRALGKWPRPRRFDWDLVVVGAGSAGLVSSLIGTTLRARVALVERDRMGGDCLNTGCVPSKALIRTTRLLARIRNSRAYGIREASAEVDFAQVMDRVQRVVKTIEPHDSRERYASLGVECIEGEATLTSPYTVEVGGRTLRTRSIVVATGAAPLVPPIPGLDRVAYRTSETIWDLRTLPRTLLVLGGGAIGCELAQCFARLGSRVTQVEMLPRLLPREDEEVSELIARRFREEGIDVRAGHVARRVEPDGEGPHRLICEHEGREIALPFDEILVALGRRPRVEGFGLEALGIGIASDRAIEVNEYLQTACPNVFACGDVAGPFQFTHVASHQAWYATVNALFRSVWRIPVDYSAIPWATFTDPEVARVGINALEARERGIAFETTRYPLSELDRAIADEAPEGWVEVLTAPGKDRVLGATVVGESAAEVITEFVSAMRHRRGLNKILGTIHIYPTLSEANRFAAGAWRRAHAPERLLRFAERYHAWRRGR